MTSPAIAALASELADTADPAAVLQAFWAGVVSPMVEPDGEEWSVTFLWRDADAEQVLLFVNRLTDERDLERSLMERLADTDVWHLAYRMPGDWRASYAVLRQLPGERPPWLDGADQAAIRAALDRGLADPLNPQSNLNRAGRRQSVVALPGAPAQPWLNARGPLRGLLSEHSLDSRTVWSYRPDEFRPGGPAVVVLDGEVWLGPQNLPVTLDNLIADQWVRPAVLLLVDSGGRQQRWTELGGSGGMPAWIADRLLPWATATHDVSTEAADRVVAGQSLGGAVALLTAAGRPDAVGAFLSQSASLWQEGLVDRIAGAMTDATVGHLEVGLQEWVLLEPNRQLHRRLRAAGVRHRYVEFNGGHDYACWRGGIADGLATTLGPPR